MNPEEKIREQRMIEATRNGYMGMLNSKFGCILQFMGQKVVGHGGTFYESSYLEDPYEQEDEDEMETFDLDAATTEVGYIFDGLSRGIHLEIKYFNYSNTMTVSFKGYRVYEEVAGELQCYFPHPCWEEKIEELYKVALKLQKESRREIRAAKEEFKEVQTKGYLRQLWEKWGLRL